MEADEGISDVITISKAINQLCHCIYCITNWRCVDRLKDQPALHYCSPVKNAPEQPAAPWSWLLELGSRSDIVDTERQSTMMVCINRSLWSLYPNCADARFQITFILTRLIVFECHFHHSYYYLIDVSAANFNKIRSILSQIQTFKNMLWAIKTCHFVSEYNSGVSWAIFLIFILLETGVSTLQCTYLITWLHHNCVTSNVMKFT